MKEINIPEIGIKILLKCDKHPVNKSDITQLYKPYKKEARNEIIDFLINHGYLESKKMPKPDVKKTPTYYFITQKGKQWVMEYLAMFET
jgi:predicted transcriptional regulator